MPQNPDTTRNTSMKTAEFSVLVVEDDPVAAGILHEVLLNHGITTHTFPRGHDALRELRANPLYGAMLIDLSLPDMDGIEVLREARRISSRLPCFILTARDQVESAVIAMKAGASDYLTKPFDITRLVQALRGAIMTAAASGDLERVATPETHWKSAAMREALRLASRAAQSDRPVMLIGPPNSGKNSLARQIHSHSHHADDGFHSIDLAALAPGQAETDLFGGDLSETRMQDLHQQGCLDRLRKGTLCLSDIELLRPAAQHALLHWLENDGAGAYCCRLITSTNADIESLVTQERFRSDLWYALSIHRIDLPPLAARIDDIPQLCEDIITSICVKRRLRRPTLTRKALDAIRAHDWPGNLSELHSALEHAVASTTDGLISPADLPPLGGRKPDGNTPETSLPSIEEITKAALISALEATGGNRRMVAEQLRVSLRTVYNMIRRYGLKDHPIPESATGKPRRRRPARGNGASPEL